MSRHCPQCGYEFQVRSLTTQTRDQLFIENMKLKKEVQVLQNELRAMRSPDAASDPRTLENRLRCQMEAMNRTANQLLGVVR